jgi:hypothetical protein
MLQALFGGFLGVALGMRHALEPDHLAAVSTLVAEERSARAGARLGAWWGLGHTAALLAVGLTLALLRAEMPARRAEGFECGVASLLFGLGVRAIDRAVRQASHVHFLRGTPAKRPLLVGVVHGLAGSGALTALALAQLPTASLRLVTIALFGCGSVLGMAVLSGLAGWPLARIGALPRAQRALSLATGSLSAGLGLFWGYPFVAEWLR